MEEQYVRNPRRIAWIMLISVAVVIATIDIYMPALPFLRGYFDTSEFLLQISIMLYPIEAALLGFIFGRIADIYGRIKSLTISFFFLALGSVLCTFANDIETFLMYRAVQCLGAGGIFVVALLVISDLFKGAEQARYMSFFGLMFPVAFAVAPIIGAYIFENFGWRYCFYFVTVLTIMVGLLLHKELPETSTRINESEQFWKLLGEVKVLLANVPFMLMILAHCVPIMLSVIFVSNAPFIFIDKFDFTPVLFSKVQSIPIIFNIVGTLFFQAHIHRLGMHKALAIGISCICAFFVFSFLVLTFGGLTAPVLVMLVSIYNLGMSFCVITCATKAIEFSGQDKAMGLSIMAFFRNGLIALGVIVVSLISDVSVYKILGAMVVVAAGYLVIAYRALNYLKDPENLGLEGTQTS
jgi:MFS family permease